MLRSHLEPLSFQERFHIRTTAAPVGEGTVTETEKPLPPAAAAPSADGTAAPSFAAEETLTYTEEPPAQEPPQEGSTAAGIVYVKTDKELPRADNRHILPASSGIIYETAEELYRREKTAAAAEALCPPPFRKVLDPRQSEVLTQQAEEEARRLTGAARPQDSRTAGTLSLLMVFCLQAVFFVPVLNVAAALWLSFREATDSGLRKYCQAFLIWTVLFMTAALCFLTAAYVSAPSHDTFWHRLTGLFAP